MRLHPRARMRRSMPWMERKRKGKGRNPNPKNDPVKGERRKTYIESSAFTVINLGTMPQSVHTRRQERIP